MVSMRLFKGVEIQNLIFSLGMHHDSSGNSCPKEGFIMSPSRGTSGETQWSTCSAQVMASLGWATCLKDSATTPHKNLDHGKFLNVPGQKYTAKKQCEILLRDKDAVVSPSQQQESICYNLQCKTPHRSGFYHAGPALEGTECGRGKVSTTLRIILEFTNYVNITEENKTSF